MRLRKAASLDEPSVEAVGSPMHATSPLGQSPRHTSVSRKIARVVDRIPGLSSTVAVCSGLSPLMLKSLKCNSLQSRQQHSRLCSLLYCLYSSLGAMLSTSWLKLNCRASCMRTTSDDTNFNTFAVLFLVYRLVSSASQGCYSIAGMEGDDEKHM
jgi:hypothetical protein